MSWTAGIPGSIGSADEPTATRPLVCRVPDLGQLAAFFAAELTAALGAAALGALTAAASTFVAVMGLTMTAFHFLTRNP